MLDLIGRKYGKFTVKAYSHKNVKRRAHIWESHCECGRVSYHDSNVITKERAKSCKTCAAQTDRAIGNQYARKHGLTKHKGPFHPLYHMRNRMMTRCYNAKASDFPYYQGKGIQVYKQWIDDPYSFYEWGVSNGWVKGMTIDRIDSDKDYCPSNCQFLSMKDNLKKMHQAKRSSHPV